MPFKKAGKIRYYGFDCFDREGIFSAIITRHEGVSPSPWDSLNLGGTVGDDRNRVIENRSLIYESFQIKRERIFDVWQVHGDQVICTDAPRPENAIHQKADAIVTNRKDIVLLMLFADCVPILLYDRVQKVIGIAHAGWKGTVLGVAEKTVKQMQENYDSKPQDIIAALGPSIGPDHYSIGIEVISKFQHVFGPAAKDFIHSVNGNVYLNLWESNRWLLEQAGVGEIENAHICTACHTEDWFSHRAENGKTGRFGVLLGLGT